MLSAVKTVYEAIEIIGPMLTFIAVHSVFILCFILKAALYYSIDHVILRIVRVFSFKNVFL